MICKRQPKKSAALLTNFQTGMSAAQEKDFGGSEESEDKIAAYKTLYEVLVGLSKLIAPFVPYISEEIYQNLVRNLDKNAPESVHFASFPVADEKMIDSTLNEGMDKVLEIVENEEFAEMAVE